jgi:hypothetical protein
MTIIEATLQAELALRVQALQAENERLSTELQIAQAAADAAQKRMRAMAQEPSDAKATQCPTCSDSFPARSYGAGFLDAVGQCENCAAGMPMTTAGAVPRLPKTAADVRAFIGPHFSALDWGQPADGEPHEDDRYAVSAHDLLSAFRDWEECGAALDEQTTGEVNG